MFRLSVLAVLLVAMSNPRPLIGQDSPSDFSIAASTRLRYEVWSWFDPPGTADNSYGYFGAQTHANLGYDNRRWLDLRLDLQNTTLLGLPDESNAPPPLGDLGVGATYFAVHNERNISRFFLNQGYVTLKSPGHAATYLRAGRFEYTNGLETITGDPTLDWLKRTRLSTRVIGTFGFSHGGRSFDGLSGALDGTKLNLTALAVHPRQGGFEIEGMKELSKVDLAALTLTVKPGTLAARTEARVFFVWYGDDRSPRDTVVKADNRSAPARAADSAAISMPMIGGHLAKALGLGGGTADALLWGVVQGGDWGLLDHRAYAVAAEIGYQPRMTGNPWIRAGYYRGSGDDDPADGTHGTFVPVLTTVRQYAQFPFYNAMNTEDLFLQLILRPIPGKFAIRTDVHRLRLTESADLWYTGSGAGQRTRSFGFGGRPSGGDRDLATLADLSLTWDPNRRISAYIYLGHAFGGQVVKGIYGEGGGDFGYGELTIRF